MRVAAPGALIHFTAITTFQLSFDVLLVIVICWLLNQQNNYNETWNIYLIENWSKVTDVNQQSTKIVAACYSCSLICGNHCYYYWVGYLINWFCACAMLWKEEVNNSKEFSNNNALESYLLSTLTRTNKMFFNKKPCLWAKNSNKR